MTEKTGACLCGLVKFKAKNADNSVHACHCGMCLKWGGAPFMGVSCGQEVSFEGSEYISIYNSSDWADRGFCSKCGSHLFYRLKGTNDHEIAAGLFDQKGSFSFDLQVFIDKKPAYYGFANNTEEMTEREVIEKYAPTQ